jgi:dihydrofolate synthase
MFRRKPKHTNADATSRRILRSRHQRDLLTLTRGKMRRRLAALAPFVRSGVEYVASTASTSTPVRCRAFTSSFTSVDECLKSLVNHEKSGVPRGAGTNTDAGFDLGRMHRLLYDFGDPHTGYNTIHISGTKGKGTTVSVLASVLRAAGLKVGTYKSPHVYTVAERIRTSGGNNDESGALLGVLNKLGSLIEGAQQRECGQLSYFEVLTALAFTYFKHVEVDIAIVEVGLGGSRDATNVLRPENLEAAVITHIGEEHLDALGGSIETIVEAKAGIAHKGRPVFYAPNVDDRVSTLLASALDAQGANDIRNIRAESRLIGYATEGSTTLQELDIDVWLDDKPEFRLSNVRVPLIGPHQRENINTCLRLLCWLRANGRLNVSVDDIRVGLETTHSPGNFEVFTRPEGSILIADGAHTNGSAKVLIQTLNELYPNRKFIFVVAMADDKDHCGFLRELYAAKPVSVYCTQINVAGGTLRTTRANVLASAHDSSSSEPEPIIDSVFDTALSNALERAEEDGAIVVVTGSLYTFTALQKALF